MHPAVGLNAFLCGAKVERATSELRCLAGAGGARGERGRARKIRRAENAQGSGWLTRAWKQRW